MGEDGLLLGQTFSVIDPDVRGHVYSLVTAVGGIFLLPSMISLTALLQLGGFNGQDADRYVLGDDALACLRDIKRWLRLYDGKNDRMDVARCLGEANLVNGDLVPALSALSYSGRLKSKQMSRIALACCKWDAQCNASLADQNSGVVGSSDLAPGDS